MCTVEDLTENMKRIAEQPGSEGESTNTGANGPVTTAPKTVTPSDKLKPLDNEARIHNLVAAARYNELFKRVPSEENPFIQRNRNAPNSG
jgi:hypothetical protein